MTVHHAWRERSAVRDRPVGHRRPAARRHPPRRPAPGREHGAVDSSRRGRPSPASPQLRDRPVQCGGLRHPADDRDISYGSPPAQIAVKVSPPVGPQQQVSLLLNQVPQHRLAAVEPAGSSAPLAFALPAFPRTTETDTFSLRSLRHPAQARSLPSSSAVRAARSRPGTTWPASAWTAPRADWRSIHPGSSAAPR